MRSVVPVSALAEQVRGVTYGKDDASSTPRPGYLPVLRAGNITEDGLTFADLVYVPADRISEKQRIRQDDVVIAASSGSLDVVGKAARALADYDGGFGAFCKVLRPGPNVDPAYFAHFFRTPQYRQRVSALAAGVNINNLRNEHLADLQIPLPPIPEQRRIAEILDEADLLRVKRRASLAQLDALSQAMFLDILGDPATNPKGWPWTPLGEIASFIRGITFKPDDVVRAEDPNTVACMRTRNVQAELDLSDTWWISERFVRRDDQMLREGDILVSSANSWNLVGKCCWIPRLPMRATFGGFVSVLRADYTKVYPEVLFTWFRSQRVQSLIRSFGQQTTNISNLNIQRTLAVRLPLAPLGTQRDFCAAVEAERALRDSQQSSASALDALFASLQARAFGGEL
jgi:type I restriction enzyme S subunit